MIDQPNLFSASTPAVPVERIDITARKHRGASTSVAANRKVNKEADAQKVLELIKTFGGSWLKEAARHMGKFPNAISGRFTWLKKTGFIKETGEVREGCKVYRWTGK